MSAAELALVAKALAPPPPAWCSAHCSGSWCSAPHAWGATLRSASGLMRRHGSGVVLEFPGLRVAKSRRDVGRSSP